ncbi:MAG: S8 family serine peptidase, partial [Firmicutes bacterium]|nr:S8 family serine peptidase [Bacillota bacterium]
EDYLVKLNDGSMNLYSAKSYEDVEQITDNIIQTSKENAEAMLEEGRAEYIEPVYPMELYDIEPNDTYYIDQIYMDAMKITELQKNYSGEGVRVAVIDSGVNRSHPDLVDANIEQGYNYIENSTDTTDTYNHGTRVTAIIAATPNNGIGIAGVAPKCTIVPLLCKTKTEGTDAHVMKAIYDAVEKYDCKIINISMGTTANSRVLREASDWAASKGAIIVAAAGNSGSKNIGQYTYPAAFDSTICVGAVTADYSLTSYTQRNDLVDVSVVYRSLYLPNISNGYTSDVGTSFCAPVITGIFTLILSRYPDFDVYDMRNIIKAAAADICDSGKDYSGYGVLMCDEIDKVFKYKQDIYISPYISGDEVKLKLFNSRAKDGCKLIKAVYKDGVYTGYTEETMEFDEDGLFYTTAAVNSGETLKLFVWDSIEGQHNLSAVK